MEKKSFRPQNLRTLLAVLFAALFLGGSVGFYWGLDVVKQYAAEVNQLLADADASGQQINQLQTLKTKLDSNTSMVDKANQVFSTPSSYQAQLLGDIRNAAGSAGVTIESTNFSDDPATPYTATVKLRNPVAYTRLIDFLNNIEGNLPKLQISSLTVGPATGSNVTVGEIKIGIAVR